MTKKLFDKCFMYGNKRCRLVVRSNNKLSLTSYQPLSVNLFSKQYHECYCVDRKFIDDALHLFYVSGGEISDLFDFFNILQRENKFFRCRSKYSSVRRCPINFDYE